MRETITGITEFEERERLTRMFAECFSQGEFDSLDWQYEHRLEHNVRMPCGDSSANRLVRSMELGAWQPGQPRPSEAYWQGVHQTARGWLQHNPDSMLAALALAKACVNQSWDCLRHANAAKAQELRSQALHTLSSRAALGREDPNWWAAMVTRAHGSRLPAQEQADLARDAIAAFPLNADIYTSIAATLVPASGGSLQALAELADLAVQNSQAEEGQSFYALIYWSVQDLLAPDGRNAFTDPQVNWPRIRAGFEDLIGHYPDPYNTNSYARLACVAARDRQATQAALALMGDHLVQQAWTGREEYIHCIDWSFG